MAVRYAVTIGILSCQVFPFPYPFFLSMQNPKIDQELATEAKAIVVLAFRNGPIESIHSGKTCPTCHGNVEYSRITDAEMKLIMKNAVDHVYRLGGIKKTDPRSLAPGISRHWKISH